MTAASGVANALILAVINAAVAAQQKGGPTGRYFVLFLLTVGLFVYSLRYMLYESSRIAEEAIRSVRERLADKIRRSDLLALESIGESDIHARVSRDTAAIVQVARPLFSAAQSAVMVFFTMAYIAIVSPVAVLICLGMILGGVGVYLKDRKRFEDGLQEASRSEDDLFGSLTGLLRGFKELRINRLKSDDVFAEFTTIAKRVRDTRVLVMRQYSNNVVFVETFFVLLIGSMVFVLPVMSPAFSGSVIKVVAAILYMMGPLSNVVIMIPVLSQVNVTVDNLRRLESELDGAVGRSAEGEEAPDAIREFQAIRFEGRALTIAPPMAAPASRWDR